MKKDSNTDHIELISLAIYEAGSISVLASKLSMSRSAIDHWLTGISKPNRASIAKLQAYLIVERLAKKLNKVEKI